MGTHFFIDQDIRKAETLPARFYRDQDVFNRMKETVFAATWQWIGDTSQVPLTNKVHPFSLLEGFLDEPMVLTRTSDTDIHCISNVCTHRANLVVEHSETSKELKCMYHGRRFALDGTFKSMPEFKEALDFPRSCDHLHKFPLAQWGPHLFTSLGPAIQIEAVFQVMNQKIGFLPLDQFQFESSLSKDYLVNCHWALYCDNYLEGFHIPFVHPDLNAALDYGSYSSILYDHCNLQIGYANSGEDVFDLPADHEDYGKQIGAYYFWVFPNMMFNFYPWGLSINIVKPIDLNRTKVAFLTYVYDANKLDRGAGALLDKVEREDEYVVESVHKGLKSRVYNTGRFSPTREQGVHHFHLLLSKFLR